MRDKLVDRGWQQKPGRVRVSTKTTSQRAPQAIRKPGHVRDRDYMDWIRLRPCIAPAGIDLCVGRVETAHTGPRGLSQKADDIRCIPLCGGHHRGPEGLDTIGRKAFEERYGIDINETCLRLISEYLQEGGRL